VNLFFANPAWLLGLLVAVPLLAHLFSKARPRRREYPSLKLLREAMRQVTRVRKPRDRWLLIVRTVAMLALIGAFLQPWLLSRFASGAAGTKTVVLIVDVSASMAYADGTQTRLAQAATAAEDVVATLTANSRANVVWLGAHATSELPEPGPNLDFLRDSLRKATARPEPGEIAGALSLALKQLSAAEGDRELVILSDFQRNAWREVNLEMPPGVRLTRVAVGGDDAANVGLAGLAIEPPRPVVGQDARVVCRVRNFSAEPRRATLFVEAGESRLSQVVEVAPWSETPAILAVKFPREGVVPVKASLGEDRFPGDDVRYALTEVRGALQVAIAGVEGDATAQTWLRAAGVLDGVAARRIAPGEIGDARAEVLFVSGWQVNQREAVAAFLKRGGAAVVSPADGLDAAVAGEWLGMPGAAGALARERREAGWTIRIAAEEHPVFSIFTSGAYGDPARGTFRARTATPIFLDKAKPLLVFDDGKPALALLDFSAGGRRPAALAWWNLDLSASDWATRPAFVTFFGEFLRYLASRATAPALREFDPGEPLRFEAAALDPSGVRLVDDRGKEVPSAPENPRVPAMLATKTAARPGSYQWLAQDNVVDRAVVNFPDSESDLRRLTAAEQEAAAGTLITGQARSRLADLREGKPLWPWFLAAAALCFLIEGVLLRVFRSTAENTPVPTARHAETKREEVAA
jgi:hypothetical protein